MLISIQKCLLTNYKWVSLFKIVEMWRYGGSLLLYNKILRNYVEINPLK